LPRDIDALVDQLTLDEKARLTSGADLWSTAAIDRVGIPAVFVTDGPNGARGPSLPGLDDGAATSACVPCGAALGATWDVALVERIGSMLGDEARTKAARVLLAPTVNLHRSPLGGRNFESYSEDPVLAGRVAAAFVRGAQSRGVVTTVKHFAGNECETERMSANSIIDERTLRELHLVPFELAVREGGSLGVMTAYNRLNGVYVPDDEALLDRILRGAWGFEGFVLTDWYALGDTVAAARAGLDLEMPGPPRFFGPKLADAVRAGDVDEALVTRAATRLLRVFDSIGALDDPPTRPESIDRPEHRALAREACAASIVLLRNQGVLPLDLTGGTLAVVGPNAAATAVMGGGSAQLTPHYQVSILDALAERLGDRVEIVHERGCDISRTLPALGTVAPGSDRPGAGRVVGPDGTAGLALEVFAGDALEGEAVERTARENGELWFFGPPAAASGPVFSVRASGSFTPDAGGRWFVSLAVAGRARLLLDGETVIDGMSEALPPGPTFLGAGSQEIRHEVELVAGRPVDVVVEMANPSGALLSGVRVAASAAPPSDLLERAVTAAAVADATLLVVGTSKEWESEGHDRETMDLPGAQDELIERVLDVCPDAVVLVNAGSPVSMPWADRTHALAQVWFGGQEMGNGVLDVITGGTDPGGRLPMTVPQRLEHNPSFGNFPPEHGEIRYGEGLLLGYRWYEARHLPPRFPFGHGLSYTTFRIGAPRLSAPTFEPGSMLRVEVDVTNTGAGAGTEVVQCYVGDPGARVQRPLKELKAFAKVGLDPGATTTVTLALDDRAFAYWSVADPKAAELDGRIDAWLTSSRPPATGTHAGWTIDPGRYEIHIGRSSADIAHIASVDVVRGGVVDG
jgi:beta-glucosidase